MKIRFLPKVARYVREKKWHSSQVLAAQADGGLLAEFHLDGTEEIKRWVLSFGGHAEVLEPRDLREDFIRELRGALANHLGDHPSTAVTDSDYRIGEQESGR